MFFFLSFSDIACRGQSNPIKSNHRFNISQPHSPCLTERDSVYVINACFWDFILFTHTFLTAYDLQTKNPLYCEIRCACVCVCVSADLKLTLPWPTFHVQPHPSLTPSLSHPYNELKWPPTPTGPGTPAFPAKLGQNMNFPPPRHIPYVYPLTRLLYSKSQPPIQTLTLLPAAAVQQVCAGCVFCVRPKQGLWVVYMCWISDVKHHVVWTWWCGLENTPQWPYSPTQH